MRLPIAAFWETIKLIVAKAQASSWFPNPHCCILTNHSLHLQQNFVDPRDRDVHTQGIEKAWARCKHDLLRLKKGTSPALLPGHLARLWWESLDRSGVRPFCRILDLIREAYPQ